MNYPKRMMSITELTEMGYGRRTLNNWSHIRGFPVIRTSKSKRAKQLVNTDKLDQWIDKNMTY